MRILLDERVPWPMHRLLTGHACSTVQDLGRGGIKNGELLQRAERQFDLFITSDQNLRYQQNLTRRRIAIPRTLN
jgi:predicted nuclease of predicted toxin-antitoxin system